MRTFSPWPPFFSSSLTGKYERSLRLSPQFQEKLLAYHWPGNIRELRNLIERTVITAPKPGEPDQSPGPERSQEALGSEEERILPLREVVRDFERTYIQRAIQTCGGNMTQAARLLGVHRTQLYRKLAEKEF